MKISTTVKSLAAVAAFAAAGFVHAQSYPISGGWDRVIPPNAVTGGSININQNPADPNGCVAALRSISLSVDSFAAFGKSFTTPTWSKAWFVDEDHGDCGKMPDDLEPFGYVDPSTLSGTYRVIYNWGESAASCGSDTTPALSLTAGSSTASPDDWSCAQLMVTADVDLVNNTFTPLSINLVVHGIDGSTSNWSNYDLY